MTAKPPQEWRSSARLSKSKYPNHPEVGTKFHAHHPRSYQEAGYPTYLAAGVGCSTNHLQGCQEMVILPRCELKVNSSLPRGKLYLEFSLSLLVILRRDSQVLWLACAATEMISSHRHSDNENQGTEPHNIPTPRTGDASTSGLPRGTCTSCQ